MVVHAILKFGRLLQRTAIREINLMDLCLHNDADEIMQRLHGSQ